MGAVGSTERNISDEVLREKMKDSSILFLDVRGRSELSGGRLKSASFMNIPHTGRNAK